MAKTRYKGVYKDKNGVIFYQAELGIDKITGKRIQKKGRKTKLGKPFANLKEAHDEMIRVQTEYNQSDGISDYNMIFERFINSEYQIAYFAGKESSTRLNAEMNFKLLVQRFGNKKLHDLTARDVEAYRLYLINESGKKQSYARQIWNRLRLALDYAVRMGYMENNPCRKTEGITLGKQFADFWTFEEFQKIINVIDTSKYIDRRNFVMIWLMYFTGVRVHEGCALLWKDVDFKEKRLRVNKTLEMWKDEEGHHHFRVKNTTKTPAGMRWIELDEITLDYLKNWKEIQAGGQEDDYIFQTYNGCAYRWTVAGAIKKYAKLAGVKNVSGKALRHSHASYLINVLQKDVLYVARRLGHTNPSITLRHYAHWFNGQGISISDDLTANMMAFGLSGLDKK